MRLIVLFVLAAGLAGQAGAQQMYRCAAPGGGVAFSDRPCGGGQAQQQIVVKPASAPDEARQRELQSEARQNRIDDIQRRSNYAIEQEAELSRRADARRQAAAQCAYAQESAARHRAYVVGGADARVYEAHKRMAEAFEEQAKRACN